DELLVEIEEESLAAFLVDEELAVADGLDQRLRGRAEKARLGEELQVARVARHRAALDVHAAREVDLQEAVVVQRKGLRRSLDAALEVDALLFGERRLVDRVL